MLPRTLRLGAHEAEDWYWTAIPQAQQQYEDYLHGSGRGWPVSGVSRQRESPNLEAYAVQTAGGQEAFNAAVSAMLDDARDWRLAEMRTRRGRPRIRSAGRALSGYARLSAGFGLGRAQLYTGGTHDWLFYSPTVLGGVTRTIPAFEDEILGPVAPVIVVKDDTEAIAVANDTEYGLVAAIQTVSRDLGGDMADQLNAGIVHVNDQTLNNDSCAPFGYSCPRQRRPLRVTEQLGRVHPVALDHRPRPGRQIPVLTSLAPATCRSAHAEVGYRARGPLAGVVLGERQRAAATELTQWWGRHRPGRHRLACCPASRTGRVGAHNCP